MAKYFNQSEVVDALRWVGTGRNQREMYDFLTNTSGNYPSTEGKTFKIVFCNGGCSLGDLYIKTSKGEIKANLGDYVVKDNECNYYPYSSEYFEHEYKEIK